MCFVNDGYYTAAIKCGYQDFALCAGRRFTFLKSGQNKVEGLWNLKYSLFVVHLQRYTTILQNHVNGINHHIIKEAFWVQLDSLHTAALSSHVLINSFLDLLTFSIKVKIKVLSNFLNHSTKINSHNLSEWELRKMLCDACKEHTKSGRTSETKCWLWQSLKYKNKKTTTTTGH